MGSPATPPMWAGWGSLDQVTLCYRSPLVQAEWPMYSLTEEQKMEENIIIVLNQVTKA